MNVLTLDPTVTSFDILDEFGRVFWKDMDATTALAAVKRLGTMYRAVPSTGLAYGAKA